MIGLVHMKYHFLYNQVPLMDVTTQLFLGMFMTLINLGVLCLIVQTLCVAVHQHHTQPVVTHKMKLVIVHVYHQ